MGMDVCECGHGICALVGRWGIYAEEDIQCHQSLSYLK